MCKEENQTHPDSGRGKKSLFFVYDDAPLLAQGRERGKLNWGRKEGE